MAKQFAYIAAICIGVALATTLAMYYFKLGWFPFHVWGVGLALAILVTRSKWRRSEKRWLSLAFVVAVYALSLVAWWYACFNHVSYETYLMTWEVNGPVSSSGEQEVLLQYVDFPGRFIGIYSSELARHLATATSPVSVTTRYTSDLGGCLRRYKRTQIGELKSWKQAGGFSRALGNANGPWEKTPPWAKDPWWCP
jgi:hypothetical protein